jgi:hypothetical protein
MHWISTIVVFVAALVFGYLSRRTPGKDWEFIQSWPAFALLFISMLMGSIEFSQSRRWEPGELKGECEWVTNEMGMPERVCQPLTYVGGGFIEPENPLQPLIDWFKNGFISILLDIPPEIIGLFLGGRLAGKKAAEFLADLSE